MTTDQTAARALLRTVLTWARANGWRPRYRWQGDVTITWSRGPDAEIGVPGEYVGVHLPDPDNIEDIRHWLFDHHGRQIPVTSVREAVDVLAALGVLPAALSSMYAAGRASVLDLLREVTDELQAVSETYCWSGNFAACVNDGCVHRRALVARARAAQAAEGCA